MSDPLPPVSSPARQQALVDAVFAVPLHVALGVTMVDPERPEAGLYLPVDELAINNIGVLHGGLVPAVLDMACFMALIPQLREGTIAVTHSTSASLVGAVSGGRVVRFTGRIDRLGRSLVFCSAEGYDGDRLVASGQVIKSVLPEG